MTFFNLPNPIRPPVKASVKSVENIPPPDVADPQKLREWWHGILRNHGRYQCYGLFLVLPTDTETIRYMKEFESELDQVTGTNCLIIVLTKTGFRRSGIDADILSLPGAGQQVSSPLLKPVTEKEDERPISPIEEQVSEGYCLTIAKQFEIKFDEFPCLLLFQDIRSSEHIVTTLKGLRAEEIALKMRSIFDIVQRAILQSKDPLDAIQKHKNNEALLAGGKAIVGGLRSLAGQTLAIALEAWLKANINQTLPSPRT